MKTQHSTSNFQHPTFKKDAFGDRFKFEMGGYMHHQFSVFECWMLDVES